MTKQKRITIQRKFPWKDWFWKVVHLPCSHWGYDTLCWLEDNNPDVPGISYLDNPFVEVNKKVTCPDCLAIIKEVKNYLKTL